MSVTQPNESGSNTMPHSFSQRLCLLMNENNVSQYTLGRAIGATRQSIAQYLDGKTQPSAEKLCAIADYFNVPTDYLLGRADYRSRNVTVQSICEATGLSGDVVENLMELHAQDAISDPDGESVSIEDWGSKKADFFDMINTLLNWPTLGHMLELSERIKMFHAAEQICTDGEKKKEALAFIQNCPESIRPVVLDPSSNIRHKQEEVRNIMKLIGYDLCNSSYSIPVTISMGLSKNAVQTHRRKIFKKLTEVANEHAET